MTDKQILLDERFSPELTRRIQEIPSGVWLKHKMAWAFPHDSALELCSKFADLSIDQPVRELARVQQARKDLLTRLYLNKMAPSGIYMAHQRRCIDIAKIYDRFGFFLDTGKQPCPAR